MVYTQAVRRGDIYYINNDRGQIGSEMKKDRPAVVVSNDMNNRYSNEITVVFLTSEPGNTCHSLQHRARVSRPV